MPALGLKTIWITMRAIDYTGRVFERAIKNIQNLSKEQKKLAIASLRSGIEAFRAGMMWATLGQMLFQSGIEMAATTKTLKPLADMFKSLNDTLSKNEGLRVLLSLLMILGGLLMMVYGATLALAGVGKILYAVQILQTKGFAAMIASILGLQGPLTALQMQLLMVGLAAGIGFALFFLLKDSLGPIPAMLIAVAVAVGILAIQLWLAAGAMSVLTWGLAAIAGAAALAGVVAMVAGVTGKQMGTMSMPYTGLVLAHQGEVIYNPATHRPTQVGNDLEREGQVPSQTFYDMPIRIENVHTKAEFDDVDEKLRKALRKGAGKRR